MGTTPRIYLASFTALIGAAVCALFAGSASLSLADALVQAGGPNAMREPINAAIAVLLYLLWRKWRPVGNYSPPVWGNIGVGLILGLLAGIILPGVALLTLSGLDMATLSMPRASPIMLGVPLVFILVHALAEEILVRGIAQREGHYHFGPWGGVLVGAGCFTLVQTLQGYGEVVQIINSALFGAVLGFLALGPGGIWAAIGAHAGWSWLEGAVMGAQGQIIKNGAWLAGSGPDSYGSPIFSLVLISVVSLQIFLQVRTQKPMIA